MKYFDYNTLKWSEEDLVPVVNAVKANQVMAGPHPFWHHPLYVGLPLPEGVEAMHDAFNIHKVVGRKIKQWNELVDDTGWDGLLWLTERPYRPWLLDLILQQDFDPIPNNVKADLIMSMWIDTESPHTNALFWRARMQWVEKNFGLNVLEGDDRKLGADLIKAVNNEGGFEVYRGTDSNEDRNSLGMSWTLDQERAEWFASRFADVKGTTPVVLAYNVTSPHFIGPINERGESEIILPYQPEFGVVEVDR